MEPTSDIRERGHTGGTGFSAPAWTRLESAHTSYREQCDRINQAPPRSSQQRRLDSYRDKDGNSLSQSPYAISPAVMRQLYPNRKNKARFSLDGNCIFHANRL